MTPKRVHTYPDFLEGSDIELKRDPSIDILKLKGYIDGELSFNLKLRDIALTRGGYPIESTLIAGRGKYDIASSNLILNIDTRLKSRGGVVELKGDTSSKVR